MPQSLPPSPSLEFEKKQAKALLRAAQNGDPEAIARIRAHMRPASGTRRANRSSPIARASSSDSVSADGETSASQDRDIAASGRGSVPSLADAQRAIARERGFASWAKLKDHIASQQPLEARASRFLEAVRRGRKGAAKRMLAEDPALGSANVWTACCVGDLRAVSGFLAENPANATSRHDPDGWAPLLYACASPFHKLDPVRGRGIVACAQALLDAGADPNCHVQAEQGDDSAPVPALYFACMSDHVALVELLLARGADPNDGESVYHAAERNHAECLERLRAHGAELSARHPRWGNTPLFFLAGYKDNDAEVATATEGMRWLLAHGADPSVTSGDDAETPLHCIARNGRGVPVVQMLLDHGADPNLKRADGRTAYVLAGRAGRQDVADYLASRGADVGGVTPVDALLLACMSPDAAAAKRLLAAEPQLLETLTPADRALLAQAAESGRVDAVRLMVELGFDLSWEGSWAGTALHLVAWRGNVSMVRVLLELGAPVNVRDSTFGSSPLGWAAHGSRHCRSADDDYCAVVEALLAAGSSHEAAINRWGEPPQAMSSRRVAKLLHERGFGAAP